MLIFIPKSTAFSKKKGEQTLSNI